MKKLTELRQELAKKQAEMRSFLDDNKIDEAKAMKEELRKLKDHIDLEVELEDNKHEDVTKTMEKRGLNKDKETATQATDEEIRSAFLKAIKGNPLKPEERALVQESVNAEGGYLVPKAVSTEINQLKRQYKSAKDIVGVVPVTTESGSYVMEDGEPTELVPFDEDNVSLAEYQPTFKNMEYKVKNYGNITPISRSFLQDETANFMNYLNGLFAKKAIRTENSRIFAELKRGKVAEVVTDMKSIKKIINVGVDPSLKNLSVIATNQDGFNALDMIEDKDGRGLLQPIATDATRFTILGMEVHVFSNVELPSVELKAPIFVGSLSEGVKFFDRNVYEVAVSTEANFKQNQNVARVVERFDVKQADSEAYVYGEIAVVE